MKKTVTNTLSALGLAGLASCATMPEIALPQNTTAELVDGILVADINDGIRLIGGTKINASTSRGPLTPLIYKGITLAEVPKYVISSYDLRVGTDRSGKLIEYELVRRQSNTGGGGGGGGSGGGGSGGGAGGGGYGGGR